MKWRFELDLGRDNLWDYDITQYVQSAEWSLGMTAPFQNMANDAKATLNVINTNGEFNPENTAVSNPFVVDGENLLRPHRRVRIVVEERYAAQILDGRIMDLHLDETAGTNANDSSDENNDALYTGVTLNAAASPVPGYRMPSFDGNDTVNLYSAALAADFDPEEGSVSFWFKASDVGIWSDPNYKWLMRLYADINNRIDIFKWDGPTNYLYFWYVANGTFSQVIADITPTTDSIHVAMTWNKAEDRMRAYVNGTQVYIDINGMGTWAGALDSFQCNLGAAYADGSFGWEGNVSHYRLYNRELSAVEVATLASEGDEVMWVGWLKKIRPAYTPAGAYTGKTTARLVCEGMKARLETVTVPLSIYEDVTGDVVVADALRLGAIPPAAPGGWLAEFPGYSEAGITTFAGENGGFAVLDTGITTFPLLGDKELTGWQAIKQVTEGERAIFYQGRDGRAVWRNRHARLLNLTSQATISDTANKAVAIDYEWDVDVIKNAIRVTVNPRKVASSTTVHDLQTPVVVPPGTSKTFEVPFRDVDGRPVGVSGMGGSPTFSGATPITTLTNIGSRAQVEIDNTANTSGATMTALPITGAPIQDRDPIVGTAMDADSVGEFGKRELALSIPALNTLQQAEDIAYFELLRRKAARPSMDIIRFRNAGNGDDNVLQLDLLMEARITATIPSQNHNSDHFIIGEKHEWSAGGENPIHDTTFYLEPAGAYQFWIAETAGFSEAGQTTYGAY